MTIKNNRHIRKIVFMVIDIIIVLFSTIATTWLINGTTNLEAIIHSLRNCFSIKRFSSNEIVS